MKKMSIFALLLAAVVATSYSVSGTYAKYTTTREYSDNARVAKWNINDISQVDLFNSTYTAVTSDNGDKVVAPGTSGTYTFQITGDVETDYTLLVEVEADDTINTDDYKPMTYTLDYDADTNPVTYDSIEDLEAAIEALYDGSQVYAAGTVSESEHTIGWSWAFENTNETNQKDTLLGNAHTGTVSLEITITAVQSSVAAN